MWAGKRRQRPADRAASNNARSQAEPLPKTEQLLTDLVKWVESHPVSHSGNLIDHFPAFFSLRHLAPQVHIPE
jgi:hypothetical protein